VVGTDSFVFNISNSEKKHFTHVYYGITSNILLVACDVYVYKRSKKFFAKPMCTDFDVDSGPGFWHVSCTNVVLRHFASNPYHFVTNIAVMLFAMSVSFIMEYWASL